MWPFLLSVTILAGVFETPVTPKLADLGWVGGKWQRTVKQKIYVEQWQKVSSNTFEGVVFSIQNSDTSITEYLRLEQFGDEIFYTARVAHNKYPVPFRLVLLEDDRCVFENPEHDFPQRITYHLEHKDRLAARVEGLDGEKILALEYEFSRIVDR